MAPPDHACPDGDGDLDDGATLAAPPRPSEIATMDTVAPPSIAGVYAAVGDSAPSQESVSVPQQVSVDRPVNNAVFSERHQALLPSLQYKTAGKLAPCFAEERCCFCSTAVGTTSNCQRPSRCLRTLCCGCSTSPAKQA